ncbi:MAG: type III polyketide synthase [Deltaproteobacteria bacterium]|nr:type III polyketide synthase [Deltaproteobacteria bacterium]
MQIVSIGTAYPFHRYTQSEITAELARAWKGGLGDREKALLERLAKSTSVEGRNLAMPLENYATVRSFTDRNHIFIKSAHELGNDAVTRALNEVDASAKTIDAIFFTTITGLAVPSIESRIALSLGMRDDVKRIPMFGLGCMAGVSGLARVHDYLKAWPSHAVVLLAVELCSLTLQLDDFSAENIVSSTLFGDGAAAVLCVGDDHPLAKNSQMETLASSAKLYEDTRHIMGWNIGGHGFKILLDPGVPQIIHEHLAGDIRNFLATQSLQTSDIRTWISHPGGPKVIQAITDALDLNEQALSISREMLAKVGNLSSASVLGILEATLERRHTSSVDTGDHAFMIAMGPGFSSEVILCRWS